MLLRDFCIRSPERSAKVAFNNIPPECGRIYSTDGGLLKGVSARLSIERSNSDDPKTCLVLFRESAWIFPRGGDKKNWCAGKLREKESSTTQNLPPFVLCDKLSATHKRVRE